MFCVLWTEPSVFSAIPSSLFSFMPALGFNVSHKPRSTSFFRPVDRTIIIILNGKRQVEDSFIYVAGEDAAKQEGLVRNVGVTHIINCAGPQCPNYLEYVRNKRRIFGMTILDCFRTRGWLLLLLFMFYFYLMLTTGFWR